MAAANGKKGYTIKFELSLSGLLGVVVVCFCIFLWMFLLGLWAGQTGLISGVSFSAPPAIPAAAKLGASRNKVEEAPVVAPTPEPESAPAPEPVASAPLLEAPVAAVPPAVPTAPPEAVDKAEVAVFYAIQVGAFKDSKHVEEALKVWRTLGYKPFLRPPVGANEHLTKVYLGHFADADTARKEAEILARKEKITPVVARVQAETAKRP